MMERTKYNSGFLRRTAHNAKILIKKVLRRLRKYTGVIKPKSFFFARRRQRAAKFSKDITVSILTPVYNTDGKMLKQMIRSVLKQTYGNWELCLTDGSDAEHAYVGSVCREFAEKDGRIRYKKIENQGISGNTNECLALSSGEYIAMLDHDDILHPEALFKVMQTVERTGADFIYTDENTFVHLPRGALRPNYKPDFAPDFLRTNNYICHLSAFSRELLNKAGGSWRSEFDGSQDYDMTLRLTEKAEKIVHIPEILYYWRASANSVAAGVDAKPYAVAAAKKAIKDHLDRTGMPGEVYDSQAPSMYRIAYEIKGTPKISIIIPNKDHVEDLKKCLDSIKSKSTWKNYEILVVENNSEDAATFEFYSSRDDIKLLRYEGDFNYSKINNFAAEQAEGGYLLFLNNDTEVITPDWMEQMLMFAQREDVGAVGAMLWYPGDTVQHAGVIVGLGGIAGHWHSELKRGNPGFMGRLCVAQNFSAVTAACLLIGKEKFKAVNGFDEEFKVAFNDVDFCMRLRKAGYLNVWTPHAELYHYESRSRGADDTAEKKKRFKSECVRFEERWSDKLKTGDPYYSRNLPLSIDNFIK